MAARDSSKWPKRIHRRQGAASVEFISVEEHKAALLDARIAGKREAFEEASRQMALYGFVGHAADFAKKAKL